MIVAINDLPFRYQFANKYEAIKSIRQWMNICKTLESAEASNVRELYDACIDTTVEIAPDCKLIQLVKEFETQDEKRYLIHLLVNLNKLDFSKNPFIYDSKESYICSSVKDGAVISLLSDEKYEKDKLCGMINDESVNVRNISTDSHLSTYKGLLGIRKYENNPKHGKNPYYDAAGRYVDPMDMTEQEAQELLNNAVEIDGKLYGKHNGKYYCFQNHHDNCYHGYRNDELDLKIKKIIDKGQ